MKTIKIEVIGSGCAKCKKLFELTKEIAKELNINNEVLYSTDISKIIAMGVMSSPVLTIDDKPILVGILPEKDRLKEIIYKNIFNESIKIEIKDEKSNNSCSCGNKC